jgi:exonuclease III
MAPVASGKLWLGASYLSRIGLVSPNPGPVDYTKVKGLRVLHLNANTLPGRGKIDEIHDILNNFCTKTIFAITESGLSPSDPKEITELKNYNVFRYDNPARGSLSVLVYYSNDIKLNKTKKFCSNEATIIVNEFTAGTDRLYFGTIYRLPQATVQFMQQFEQALQSTVVSDRQVLGVGDLNINWRNIDHCTRQYKQF